MKNGIVKIWVCRECEKEYIDRPMMCSSCECLDFYVKYGGLITDAEELKDLVGTYKDDKKDKKNRVRM